jgi:quinol monooxygenase YgiN
VRTGLTVIAYVTAKAGHQDQVREALLDLVAQTRNEKGCINYDLHQSQENAREFAIYENWTSASDLGVHAKSAHLQAFTRIAGHLLEGPAEIRKWCMVSELSDPAGNA